jgi:type III pantothenate kinase
MLIAIDIGNTRIKAGKFVHDKLTEFLSFNNVTGVLKFLKSESVLKAHQPLTEKNNIAISSVVPDKTKIISEEVFKITGKSPFIISKDIKTNLTISYKSPETLGIDRFCSAEGALFLFNNSEKYKNYNVGSYILSIDFGTTTTINVVEHPGNFIGGLIAPGLEMMFESLKQKTAQLPHLGVSDFTSLIGNDTNSSIASGVITSVVGMIEKTINHLKEKTVGTRRALSLQEVFIYLTGGNAKKIIPYLNFDFIYEEELVLYGINALYELNKN